MQLKENKIINSSVLHVVMGAALAAGATISLTDVAFARGQLSGAPTANTSSVNPTAVARGQLPNAPAAPSPQAPLQLAACTPCGGQKRGCGACNPCAAKKGCGACNPCAAKNACSPSKGCNPCAAKKGCGACNPCAPKNACGACNPCNPCNPCGAGGKMAANECAIPRLASAALCNPCAAKKACGACNPCSAKKGCGACNPCNPCAAKNACGACNPCNPCGGGEVAELTAGEARKAYDCLIKDLVAGYSKSGLKVSSYYKDWKNYSNQPYVSDTHGGRYVNNYGNALAASYNKYENAGRMPVGAIAAKDSFVTKANGKVGPGPLFLMEKMSSNFNKDSGNWRYTMVLPNGQVFGTTNGAGSAKMKFCYECHMAVAVEQDSLMFLPDEYRVQ